MRPIYLVVVHHSASALETTWGQIERWHMLKGWLGSGYHRIIEADGEIYDGRRVQKVGAHVRGRNKRSFGICVIGNNTVANQMWTPMQETALADELMYWHRRLPEALFCGHRDLAATKCPGLDLAWWCRDRNLDLPMLVTSHGKV